MKIGINLLPLYSGKIGGMENYIRELIKNFPIVDNGKNEYYIVLNKTAYDTFKESERVHRVFMEHETSELLLIKGLNEIIDRYKFDFWFCPLLDLFPKCLKIPSAITIPDMQHEYYPNFFKEETLVWRKNNFKISAEFADIVFTISKSSADDIKEKLGLKEDKIICTYLDCSGRFKKLKNKNKEPVRKKYNLPEEYIFYPANFWPHKNHEMLFKALDYYKKTFKKNINLVLTGYDYNDLARIKKSIKRFRIQESVTILGYVKDEDMPFLYANATALVFPSLFEGFGIPIIEAMWQECPVICSKTTSLPEIGKDAVLYVNPLDYKEIALRIRDLISDSELRDCLIRKAKEVRKSFSYEKCAMETLKAIEKIARKKRQEPKKQLLVSIVTPSYNQVEFIEETIKSVVSQDYPLIEYIIMDGGSTDGSVEIIKKYAKKYPFIKWFSEKDNGQSDAINKGLKLCNGDIVAFLNSDDTYYPYTIKKIVEYFANNKKIDIIYGEGEYIDKDGKEFERYNTLPFSRDLLKYLCFICQPTLFMRREVRERVGWFNEKLHTCLDYEYWIRASRDYFFGYIPYKLATSRMHLKNGTIVLRSQVFKDVISTVRKYYGYVPISWLMGYADYKISKVDQILIKKPSNETLLYILTSLLYIQYNFKYPKYSYLEIKSILMRNKFLIRNFGRYKRFAESSILKIFNK